MVLARDLLIQEFFANAGPRDAEAWHPVDGVDGYAEAVGLVANGKFQRRIDIAMLLVATHVNVLLVGPAVGEPVDEPRIAVEVDDHRFIRCV